jgi:transcriptional regulator with XRE-family HTH domain
MSINDRSSTSASAGADAGQTVKQRKQRKNPKKKKHHEIQAVKVDQRRPVIADLYCKGWTQEQIGEHLGISRGRVSQELVAMREIWRTEFLEAVDTMKAAEVRRILHLERTYWREFDKSCKKRIYPKKADGEIDYDAPEDKVKVVEVLGDADLLAGIRGCIELRCKVLGLAKETAAPQMNVFTVESVASAVVEARKAEENDRLAEVERLMMDVGEDGIARMSAAAVGAAQGDGHGAHAAE